MVKTKRRFQLGKKYVFTKKKFMQINKDEYKNSKVWVNGINGREVIITSDQLGYVVFRGRAMIVHIVWCKQIQGGK